MGVGCEICAYTLQAHIGDALMFAKEGQTQKLRAFDTHDESGHGECDGRHEDDTCCRNFSECGVNIQVCAQGLPRGETGDLYGHASNSEVFFFLGATRPIWLCTTSA